MKEVSMASVNRVILVGNLGRDPEMRTFPNGDQVANVRIATTDKWRDKQTGENKEATEWHTVIFAGRLAEIAGEHLRQGSQVYVEGSLRTRKWTDNKSGQDRYSTEIRADHMQMLGSRPGGSNGRDERQQHPRNAPAPAPRPAPPPRQAPAPSQHGGGHGFEDMDDDPIPF